MDNIQLSWQIPTIVIAIMAFIVCIFLGIKAVRNKDISRVGDIIPRAYLVAIYIILTLDSTITVNDRATLVRYGLACLLGVEIAYNVIGVISKYLGKFIAFWRQK